MPLKSLKVTRLPRQQKTNISKKKGKGSVAKTWKKWERTTKGRVRTRNYVPKDLVHKMGYHMSGSSHTKRGHKAGRVKIKKEGGAKKRKGCQEEKQKPKIRCV